MHNAAAIAFQPLYDMVLVRPDPGALEKWGSLFLPPSATPGADKAGDARDCFTGTVVAVGPGDRHVPYGRLKCSECGKKFKWNARYCWFDCGCEMTHVEIEDAERWNEGRYPMHLKPGDRVVFPRRPSMPGGDFSVEIGEEKFVMFHEEQFAYAVID